MSINQVINGKNRLVEHPNRYKLNVVSRQANTYDFEKQPGEIIETGTPYAKTILDKIDNVLSYLTPSVEKIASITPINARFYFELPSTISGQTFDAIMKNDYTNDTLNVTFKIVGTGASYGYRYNTSTANHYISLLGNYNGTSTAVYSNINKVFAENNGTSSFSIFPYATNNTYENNVTIDLTNSTNIKLNYSMTSSVIQYSYDNINYTTLAQPSDYIEETIDVPNNCYLRIKIVGVISCQIRKFNIFKDINITEYQNQFTLDNNVTTFTNNQRVLVETPSTNIYNILNSSSTLETSLDGLTIQNNELSITATSVLNNYPLINIISANNFYESQTLSLSGSIESVIIDFRKPYTFKDMTIYLGDTTDILYSLNGIDYTPITYQFTSYTNLLIDLSNINARYIKLLYTYTSGKAVNFIVKNLNFNVINETGMSLDGVTSNTINNVTCDTLLHPSTKYELIYNASNNKFELGGAETLLDITLNEAVNQVDLTGIFEKMKDDKLYVMLFENFGSDAYYVLGDIAITDNAKFSKESFALIKRNGTKYNAISISGTNVRNVSHTIQGNEIIKAVTTLSAGTQIIIKEIC